MKDIGERLKALRGERNLTLAETARQADVSAATIGKWEKGAEPCSIRKVLRLARFFDVSIDYLFGLTQNRQGHRKTKGSLKEKEPFNEN